MTTETMSDAEAATAAAAGVGAGGGGGGGAQHEPQAGSNGGDGPVSKDVADVAEQVRCWQSQRERVSE